MGILDGSQISVNWLNLMMILMILILDQRLRRDGVREMTFRIFTGPPKLVGHCGALLAAVAVTHFHLFFQHCKTNVGFQPFTLSYRSAWTKSLSSSGWLRPTRLDFDARVPRTESLGKVQNCAFVRFFSACCDNSSVRCAFNGVCTHHGEWEFLHSTSLHMARYEAKRSGEIRSRTNTTKD